MTAAPSVTVVVVARNEQAKIGACIGSLAAQDYPGLAVILIDDGSTDATIARAREAMPSLEVLSSPTRSISRNRDLGWRAARSEFVAYLDADCIAPPGWVAALVRAALESGAAAVGGGNRPPAGQSAHFAALGLMLQTFAGSRGSIQGQVPREARFVAHLPGLNVLYRRDALELVGGFDPRFARMGEDDDLSRRLGDLGLRLFVTPDATVIHRQRSDLGSWARNMRGYGRGRTWLMRRHPNTLSPLFALPPVALALLPLYLPLIAAYAGWVALRGRQPGLWPRLALTFAATHLAYGWGQLEGLVIRGDNPAARTVRPRRIAVLALKNSGNKGDEAICLSVTTRLQAELRRRGDPAQVYVGAIGPSGFDLRPVPGNAEARARMITDMLTPSNASRSIGPPALSHLLRLLWTVSRFDALVIGGGQWLHDLNLFRHAVVCAIFACARVCRTRTGVFCVGVGPLERRVSRALLRCAFSRSSLMATRDIRSAQLLHRCGLPQARAYTDPALALPLPPRAEARRRILVSPCAWASFENSFTLDRSEIDATARNLAAVIAALRARGEEVAFLPTMNPEDTEFSAGFLAAFPDIAIIRTEALSPLAVQAHIAGAKALVSMRLHPVIFAYNAQTPFVALSFADKIPAFCDQAGLGHWAVDIRRPDWATQVLALLDDPEHASDAFDPAIRTRLEGELAAAYESLCDWLPLASPGPRPLADARIGMAR